MMNVSDYQANGYVVLKQFFKNEELRQLESALRTFHGNWLKDNNCAYQSGAINSAYISASQYLQAPERSVLLKFMMTQKLTDVVKALIVNKPAFMNNQLFFDPLNKAQKNYWHRDIQYHLNISEQQQALSGPDVIHVRVPLVKERGIEIVPGSHKNWDTDQQLNIRTASLGYNNYDDIPEGKAIALDRGDLLVFSANSIHRGLYGLDRLSFDIIFCPAQKDLLKFVNRDCLPDKETLAQVEQAELFVNTLTTLKSINNEN